MYNILRFLESAWIRVQLRLLLQSLGDKREQRCPSELLLIFLEKADTCSSFHEILKIRVNQWSLWKVLVVGEGVVPLFNWYGKHRHTWQLSKFIV